MAKTELKCDILTDESFSVTDVFLGQIAHDFGNLLMPLLTYPQLLRMSLGDNSPDNDLVEGIENASSDIENITRQIAALSTRNLEPMNDVDLSRTAAKALQSVSSRVDATGAFPELHASLEPVIVSGYADQLQIAIANLITNAADAAPDGKIDIETGTANLESQRSLVEGKILPAGRWPYVRVTDNGCGIDSEASGQVFCPFYTTKKGNRPRGAGLGLCVVFRTQYLHNGYVELSSTLGEGSSFTLYYPENGC